MNPVPLLRLLSLFLVGGSITALVVGTGAFALPQRHYSASAVPSSTSDMSPNASYVENASATNNTNALNWAGYVATGGTYTSVSGSWDVPTVTDGSSGNVADATWVGIGGVVTNDLIQAGTEAVPNSDGSISYQAWMETLPQDSRVVPLDISPGDSVSVSITENGSGVWDVSFVDSTTGKSYETSVRYDSSLSSADWVEEMPVEVGGVIGLDDFGQVNFSSGYAIKNGSAVTVASSGATPLTMENAHGEAVATPSALSSAGTSFSVARTNAASTPLALAPSGISVVDVGASPYVYQTGGSYGYGGYTLRSHRGRGGGYRIELQF